jgi:hypothetical protein
MTAQPGRQRELRLWLVLVVAITALVVATAVKGRSRGPPARPDQGRAASSRVPHRLRASFASTRAPATPSLRRRSGWLGARPSPSR